MMNPRFFVCEHCGNQIELIDDHGVPVMCCGQPMSELIPGTVDASHEKHIPQPEVVDGKVIVRVGSVEHPMTKEHYISFFSYVRFDRVLTVKLYPEQSSEVRFPQMRGGKMYFYCNEHGLFELKI